ncbi:MAG: polysaccharide deacetylase family protein [bacterium]
MYHSIGIPNSNWHLNHLTCPYKIFESQIAWLYRNNYRTISLNDLYGNIFKRKIISKKSIILTFDDGYVDNWIFAYPLLKKYNMTATIFVNPEFVDPRKIKRKRYDQCKNVNELETLGFLSWDEMIEMESTNVIDIQNHALTHTHYPINDNIIDFRHPDDPYIHLTWNNNVKKKPFLQIDNENLKEYGEPVYEMGSSLRNRKYLQDNNLRNHIIEYINSKGGNTFFEDTHWKKVLFKQVEKYKENFKLKARYETNEEFTERIKQEINLSREILENNLNKTIDFLCWPEGSATNLGVELARTAGYKMTTAGKDNPLLRKKLKNSPNHKSDRIVRHGTAIYNSIHHNKRLVRYCKGGQIFVKISYFRNPFNNYLSKVILFLYKYYFDIKHRINK